MHSVAVVTANLLFPFFTIRISSNNKDIEKISRYKCYMDDIIAIHFYDYIIILASTWREKDHGPSITGRSIELSPKLKNFKSIIQIIQS